MIGLALVFAAALTAEGIILGLIGLSSELIIYVACGQILLGCVMVAILDPTFSIGYIFSVLMFVTCLVFALCKPGDQILNGTLFGVALLCPSAMSLTYWIRTKRNHYRQIHQSGKFRIV